MTIEDVALPGLRERKRRATRRAIQVAALELVSANGVDGVTIDEITRRADVAPRTFFNYFASKEDALLGDHLELPSAERVEEFVAGPGSVIEGLASMLTEASSSVMHDIQVAKLRQGLLKRYPQLFAARMATMREFEESVAEIVARRLVRDDPAFATPTEALINRARLITLVSFAAMRNAWISWANGEASSHLTDRLAESFDELGALLRSGGP